MENGNHRIRKLTKDDLDMILTNRGLGLSAKENAESIGVSYTAINNALLVFDLVRQKKWDHLKARVISSNTGKTTLEWAEEKSGNTLPADIWDAYYLNLKKYHKPCESETEEEKETPQNEAVYLLKILEILGAQQEGLKNVTEQLQVLTNVAIPDLIKDISANNNANADVLNKTLLEIRMNTRRRGT